MTDRAYTYETKPYAHQLQALAKARGRREFAYLMEMGTGKTKVAIDEACQLYEAGEIDTMCVFAPKGVYINWIEREFPPHMPKRIRDKALIVDWQPGGGPEYHKKRLRKLCDEGYKGLRVLVINTEAMGQGSDLAIRFVNAFLARGRCYMLVDESSFIMNDSRRTKAICHLGPMAEYRRILTGSPVAKSPLDVFWQFEFLRPGILGSRGWYPFRARYAIIKKAKYTIKRKMPDGSLRDTGKKPHVIVAYRNEDDLAERISEHSFRVTKDQCLDLPPKVYEWRDVELTTEQRRLYNEMRDFSIADLGQQKFVTGPMAITKLQRLHQIVCGHTVDDDGVEHMIPNNRVSALMEVVAETSSKVVIWAGYRTDIAQIVAALTAEYGAAAVAEYHGGNTSTRQIDVNRFIDDPTCRYMVSNPQTGGFGNTWVVATTIVYYSNDHNLLHRLQSEDRTHRSGQTLSTTYVDLVAPKTVDEKIIKALRNKIDIAAAITRDGYKDWLI